MSIAEIKQTKQDLIAWINQLSDPSMLTVLDGLRHSKNDWWENLTELQQTHINEGIADAESSRIFSSDDFWKILKNG